MSWLVSWASSNVAISVCICLEVHLSTLNSSWLSSSIWNFSPYDESIDVRVLVKTLYRVFASVIGLWLDSKDGSPFL